MKYQKTILIIIILSLLIPLGVVFADELAEPDYCKDDFCKSKDMEISRTIGEEKCSCCHDTGVPDEDGNPVYDCLCQGSNPRGDCHVGGLISDPICACCGDCTLYNALELGTNIAQIILKYLGVIALALFVLGGIMWLTSGGAQQKIETGKKIIVGALIGLVIVLAAFLIVQFVLKRLAPGYEMEEESRRPWLICTNSATDSDNLIDVSNYFRLNSFVYS